MTTFAQKETALDRMKAKYWIRQWFVYLQDMADVRKHIIGVYADASKATKRVKTGDGTYEEVPDWRIRMEAGSKMDEWYEKTINQIYRAAKQKDSPIDAKEFDALGPRGMVEDTYKRIREAGIEEPAEPGGDSIAS